MEEATGVLLAMEATATVATAAAATEEEATATLEATEEGRS